MCLLDGGGLVECSRGAVGHRGGVVVGGAVVVGGGGRGAPSADLLESLCVVVVSQVDKLVEGASVNLPRERWGCTNTVSNNEKGFWSGLIIG